MLLAKINCKLCQLCLNTKIYFSILYKNIVPNNTSLFNFTIHESILLQGMILDYRLVNCARKTNQSKNNQKMILWPVSSIKQLQKKKVSALNIRGIYLKQKLTKFYQFIWKLQHLKIFEVHIWIRSYDLFVRNARFYWWSYHRFYKYNHVN